MSIVRKRDEESEGVLAKRARTEDEVPTIAPLNSL